MRWLPRPECHEPMCMESVSSHMVCGVRILLYDHVPAEYKERALHRMETCLCIKHWKSPRVFDRTKTIRWGTEYPMERKWR